MAVLRNGFAHRLAHADHCLVGTRMKIPALEPVEILADAGFDFIVVDQEHAPLTFEFAYRATVVAQGAGMSVLVRVPDRSGSHLQRLLDTGVDGILVPRVTSAAEATAAVRQMLFPPGGDRGMGITSRAGQARVAADRGFRYVMVGNDTGLLRSAATRVVADFR